MCTGVQLCPDDFHNRIEDVITILVMLYADETVLLPFDPRELQKILDSFYEYCNQRKLNINVEKSKIIVFGGNKKRL